MNEEVEPQGNSDGAHNEHPSFEDPKASKPPYYHHRTKTYQEEVGKFGHRIFLRPVGFVIRFTDGHNGFITAVATAVIAGFTWSLADDSARQARISNNTLNVVGGQLDEMKKAFVVDRAYVWGNFSGYKGEKPIPRRATFFSFHNYGKTPADVRNAPAAECVYGTRAPDISREFEIPGFTDREGKIPAGMIAAVDQTIGPFDAPLDATSKEIADAQTGIGSIYCVSKIIYEDVRGNSHETRNCWRYNFTFSAFVMCQDPNTNFHN